MVEKILGVKLGMMFPLNIYREKNGRGEAIYGMYKDSTP